MEMVDVAKNRRPSARELLEELGNLLGGLGVVAMSGFWLAAPILALAMALALPLGVLMGTEARGAPNAKAKRELGWTLRYPSWRQGFEAVYAPSPPTAAAKLIPR